MQNAGLDEAQAGIMIAGRNISNFRWTDDTNIMAEREEKLKSLLMKANEESEKAGLIVRVWFMRQGAQGWCTGMTLKDGMGRELGGDSGWEYMYTHGWFMSMYGKNHYNIVK